MNSNNTKILNNVLSEWYEYGKNSTTRFYESKEYTIPKVVRASSVYGHNIMEYTIFGSVEYNFPLITDYLAYLDFEKNTMYNSEIIKHGPDSNLFYSRYLTYMNTFKSTAIYDLTRRHCILDLLSGDFSSKEKSFKEDGFFNLFELLYTADLCTEIVYMLDGAHGYKLVLNDLEKIYGINFSEFIKCKRILNNMLLHGANKYGNEMFFYAPRDMKFTAIIPFILYKRKITKFKQILSQLLKVLVAELEDIETITRLNNK